MALYPIYARGIKAYCSDMIIDPYENRTIYFMSICGYQTAIKGIIANFFEGCSLLLEIEDNKQYLRKSYLRYSSHIKKLPSGLVHAILFPKLSLPKNNEEEQNMFYIFTDETKEVLTLFFRHLDEKTEIPLHSSWESWLWKIFNEQENWLLELKTLIGDFKGYSIEFNPEQLYQIISEEIKNKDSEIINCMKYGGNGNGKLDLS